MKFARALILLALFCVDVHVRAEEVCWGKTLPCPVQAKEGLRKLEAKSLKLSLAQGSLLEQRDGQVIELINGQFYVATSSRVKFQTPYGKVWCEDECKAIFERQVAHLTVRSLAGSWRVTRTGDAQVYVLGPGLQTRIGEVESEGRAAMEVPQSLPWSQTARLWAALYPGDFKDFKAELAAFRELWRLGVESASANQERSAQRTIASFEQAQTQQRARQKAREQEDESLRQLFRQKNYVNP